jgi:hypothetical protein
MGWFKRRIQHYVLGMGQGAPEPRPPVPPLPDLRNWDGIDGGSVEPGETVAVDDAKDE